MRSDSEREPLLIHENESSDRDLERDATRRKGASDRGGRTVGWQRASVSKIREELLGVLTESEREPTEKILDDWWLVDVQETEDERVLPVKRKSLWRPYWNLLGRNRSYLLLFTGNIISRFGDSLSYIASLTILSRYSDSKLLLSALLITRLLPRLLLSPVVGVLSDRFDRRVQMVFSDLCRVVVALLYLFARSRETVWVLFVCAFLQFSFSTLYEPSRASLIPSVIANEDLTTANALDGVVWACMTALGSALGGLITTYAGTDVDFLIDAFTYLVSVATVLPLFRLDLLQSKRLAEESSARERGLISAVPDDVLRGEFSASEFSTNCDPEDEELTPIEYALGASYEVLTQLNKQDAADDAETGLSPTLCQRLASVLSVKTNVNPNQSVNPCRMLAGGMKFVYGNPFILGVTFIKLTSQFLEAACNEGNIVFSQDIYELGDNGSTSLGLLYTFLGISTFFGPILCNRFVRGTRLGFSGVVLGGFILQAAGAFALMFSFNPWYFLIVNMLRSSGTSILWVYSTAMIQERTLDRYRGRVLSYDLACGVLGQIAGIIVAGVLLQDTMTVYGLMGATGVCGFAVVIGFLSFFHFGGHLYYQPCTEM
mmetsp:Transcript_52389/g.131660  ORF Transcript_52389/g.131660 Transcript_52389/m.131660 type:complete len:602 (-) Transcript_52389:29-1834(-)|eukprot:CAMPEP_0177646480 /NCGR_PEP_ID=MMETSP0447-20121125/9795_1 /TAXON_ID=0 /ORGANISM="Stygamoeba regulata, Strain BSH-02190019" /LENGTH=601 /DNA_ID=CAMNT_0019149013 /DNA_START=129 /DNA_END=1934 /DNA_ORIENTATION=+